MLRISVNIGKLLFSGKKYQITLVRHGQSIWNKEKRWAGWADVPLSQQGIHEVKQCAKLLKNRGITYDVVYTSMLTRAIKTANYILEDLDIYFIPVQKQWRLNQKHYGALQGVSKVEARQKYGEDVITNWRRSMNTPPPPMQKSDPNHPINNNKYKDIDPNLLPSGECLADVIKRMSPLWQENISKDIKQKKDVLIVAHGNSLRSLVSIMNPKMSEQDLKHYNIPNATPIIIELDQNLQEIKKQYLGDQQQIAAKMKKIKYQTRKQNETTL